MDYEMVIRLEASPYEALIDFGRFVAESNIECTNIRGYSSNYLLFTVDSEAAYTAIKLRYSEQLVDKQTLLNEIEDQRYGRLGGAMGQSAHSQYQAYQNAANMGSSAYSNQLAQMQQQSMPPSELLKWLGMK